jgi:SAM-dependent methyltransferase
LTFLAAIAYKEPPMLAAATSVASRVAQNCQGCGGPLEPRFQEVPDPQTGEVFSIAACARCGLGQTFPQPDDLGKYYGPAYHGGRHSVTARYCSLRRERFVRQTAGPARGRRLLDIGCGDGTFLIGARSEGWDVAGTELNPAVAEAAGLRVWTRLEDAASFAPFGCITMWHTLEHMRHPREVLEQAARWLEPGGTLLVAVPNADGLQARFFGSGWFHLDVPRHLFHFGPASLSRMIEAVGLEVTRSFHMEIEYDLFGWTQSALNRLFSEPNMFFNLITARSPRASVFTKAASLGAGTVLSALSAPLVAAGTLTARGGTLVMAARKPA